MRRRGGGKRLKRCRPGRTVMGRMGIRMRGRMGVGRVRRRRCPRIEVRMIILIHHLGAAHHPARAWHPRPGLTTCVPERRTTRSNTTTTWLLHSLLITFLLFSLLLLIRLLFLSLFFLFCFFFSLRQAKISIQPCHVHQTTSVSVTSSYLIEPPNDLKQRDDLFG